MVDFRFNAPRAFEFGQDSHNATGPVDVLDMVRRAWGNFAEHGNTTRNLVDVHHGEEDSGFMGNR